MATVRLLIIDDLGMRKLPPTAAEDLLEAIMRRYERAATLLTSNRPVDDWAKLLGDTLPSRPYSTAYSITRTSSNAGREAGARRSTPTCAPRRPRSRTPLVSTATRVVAGFEVSIGGRF